MWQNDQAAYFRFVKKRTFLFKNDDASPFWVGTLEIW